MNVQSAVIFNKTEFAELVHEKVHSGACRSDNLGKSFLAHLGNYLLGFAFFSEVGQEEQDSRQPFLARVEELVHEVLLDADIAREDVCQEKFGEFRLVVDYLRRDRGLPVGQETG